MSYGFAIRQPNGRLWCSPDVTPMVFHERITLNAGLHWGFTTTVPANQPIMIFYKSKGKEYVEFSNTYWGDALSFERVSKAGYHYYNIRGSLVYTTEYYNKLLFGVDIYVFTTAYSKKQSNYGLNIFDKQGRLTYSAEMIPLQLKSKDRSTIPKRLNLDREGRYNFGVTIAVSPSLVYYVSAKTGTELGYRYNTEMYFTSTDGAGTYIEHPLYFSQSASPAPRTWYGLKKIFYIETEIYDRYINMTK